MHVLALENLCKRYPGASHAAVEDLSLEVEEGELLTLLGESGSGKTTTLRMIAGFEIPDSGSISIGSTVVSDQRRFLPAEKRGIRIVFQESTLFPHLTVGRNLAFGLSRLPASQRRQRIEEMLDLLDMRGYEKRFPHELSGGQKQRVELARALATHPALLLLDEPFSSLDQVLKAQVRDEVSRLLRRTGTTSVFVTHDIQDALGVSDRVAVLRQGRLQQLGTPRQIYERPRNRYVAEFLGATNVLSGRRTAQGVETDIGLIRCKAAAAVGEQVLLSIRPESFALADGEPEAIQASVEEVTYMGHTQEVLVTASHANGRQAKLKLHLSGRPLAASDRIWLKILGRGIHAIED